MIGVYRPPSSAANWFEVFNELVMETTILGPLIIMGDLNADLLKPNEYPGNALMKSLALAKTAVTDISPTRITEINSTCLDIIATSTDLLCGYACSK